MVDGNEVPSRWTPITHKDEPVDDAKLLGLGTTVETLSRFLSSGTLVSPLVIAINGEWGSGKTSLIKTIKKKLDENGKVTSVFFDAWKWEYSEPAAALFYTIAKRLELSKRNMSQDAVGLAKLALDMFARHYAGMSIAEMRDHFQSTIKSVTTVSEELEKMVKESFPDKRVVVFVDDLDRCSLENVLGVLDTLKLFLGIKNFVFVIAVDISKLKLAWSFKYGKIDVFVKEGLKYLEKIFQIEKAIPQPTPEQVKDYVRYLNPKIPADFVELISLTNIRNPRNIKRLLNLISLRASVRENLPMTTEVALLWTVFETMVEKQLASNLYDQYGASNFYDFLILVDSPSYVKAVGSDDKKADDLIESLSTNREMRNRRDFSSLLYNDKLDEFNIPLKKRIAIFLYKGEKIISKYKQQKAETINCISDVVSFSKDIAI